MQSSMAQVAQTGMIIAKQDSPETILPKASSENPF